MRYGIFSDVHSNLEALEAVLEAYRHEVIDQYLCVGDIVGYGADPGSCIASVRTVAGTAVAGNHDWACVGKLSTRYFNPHARAAVEWTAERLTTDEKNYLRTRELIFTDGSIVLVHGTLVEPEAFDYLYDEEDAAATFVELKAKVCFLGHTHLPGFFIRGTTGAVDFRSAGHCECEQSSRYIVNVGSVGQPRDHDPRACYCIFDSSKETIEIKRVKYDVEKARRKILGAGLPVILGERLRTGR